MDLGAYVQITDLEKVAQANGIEVPRLRGYRLMENEEPVPAADIKQMLKDCEIRACDDLCCSWPYWTYKADCWSHGWRTDLICDHYLIKGANNEHVGIRWDRIHGWKRKTLKFAIKKEKKKVLRQYELWNKYAGQKGVLYIHARIGGGNWDCYGGNELMKQPWFLERADDSYDGTYCDIYAAIKNEEEEK